jgi:Chaperone of endosialidase
MQSRNVTWYVAIMLLAALVVPVRPAAQVAGTGTTSFVPRWTNSTTLGNSNISDAGGTVNVIGKNGTVGSNGGNAPIVLKVTGGLGVSGGAGGLIQAMSGNGAPLGGFTALGGTGAVVLITGGGGAVCSAASTRCGGYYGGDGGSVTLQPGSGGRGLTSSGHSGKVLLAPTGGNVGIGENNPAHTLEIKIGGTTLADGWTTRSSRRIKTNIQPLQGALEKVERLQGVSYVRKSDGEREIGVVAEDVDQIIPEVVSHDPETHEVQGVDYSRLAALLIEAVKSQQVEIERLKRRIAQSTSIVSGR